MGIKKILPAGPILTRPDTDERRKTLSFGRFDFVRLLNNADIKMESIIG